MKVNLKWFRPTNPRKERELENNSLFNIYWNIEGWQSNFSILKLKKRRQP